MARALENTVGPVTCAIVKLIERRSPAVACKIGQFAGGPIVTREGAEANSIPIFAFIEKTEVEGSFYEVKSAGVSVRELAGLPSMLFAVKAGERVRGQMIPGGKGAAVQYIDGVGSYQRLIGKDFARGDFQ